MIPAVASTHDGWRPENPKLSAEDLTVGETIELGDQFVSRADIVDFASQWDPLPFHTDPSAARLTVFGDIIGSGVHLMAIYQRLAVLSANQKWTIVAGRSIRDAQFMSPLRPDTTVRTTVTIESVTSHSAEDASVSLLGRVLHHDIVLMSVHVDAYVLRRT